MFVFEQDEKYVSQKKEFDLYYQDKLLPLLHKNDKVRRKYFMAFIVLLLMAVIFYPALLWFLITYQIGQNNGIDVGPVIGASGLLIGLLSGPMFFYKRKAKSGIMEDFAGFFGTFSYQLDRHLSDGVIQDSHLFGEYNNHISDDYFSGTYQDIEITISEEKLEKISYDYKNNKIRKKIFSGICVMLSMNKNFKGRTVALKDKGLLNAFNRVDGLERVKLEDALFESIFEVYSDDQIEARYLLTTAFMERMLKLRDLFGGKSVQFSFMDNRLLIAIPTKQNMFEASSFFRSNVNKTKIDKVFNQFYTVFSIVDILKLNQRLGM